MNHMRTKTIVRGVTTLALCTTLSLNSASAYAETPAAQDAVMASLPFGYLSASARTTVDSANSTEDMQAAKSKLEESQRKAQAAAQAAATAQKRLQQLQTDPIVPRAIRPTQSLRADAVVKNNFKKLGNYRLSFYCPCVTCNGRADAKTKSGTKMAEGRTIAVDSRIIPLGSRVYIDGYGVFIAEDTGSAIKGNRIDVCVSSHSRAYDLGIDYADVYLIG